MIQRYGMVIGIRPDRVEAYERLHASVWPEVLEVIRRAGIRNFSIFRKDEWLFGYLEYEGDIAASFRWMAEQDVIREWYRLCEPCQVPLASCASGEWWAGMNEIFHLP
jgi:L-rhamnose mutarotase